MTKIAVGKVIENDVRPDSYSLHFTLATDSYLLLTIHPGVNDLTSTLCVTVSYFASVQ